MELLLKGKRLKFNHILLQKALFNDSIEADFINFNSGSEVEIGMAKEKASLVIIT